MPTSFFYPNGRKYNWKFFVMALIMCAVISCLLALVIYTVQVQSSNGELQYSMAEPMRQTRDTGEDIYFPFGTKDTTTPENAGNISFVIPNGFKCPRRYFLCNSTMTCLELSRRCDGVVDCPNAEDELNCVCAFRMPLAKFCDKYPDCFDESDENFCNYCPPNSYNCGNGRCIPRNKVCDSKIDCENAMDENFCFRLSEQSPFASVEGPTNSMSKTGFLLKNQNGVWYPICATRHDAMQDALASHACVSITANPLASSTHHPQKFNSARDTKDYVYHIFGRFVQWNGCLTKEGIFVTCDDVLCGFNPKLLLPRPSQGRIVGGELSEPGAWPWHAAVYRNGSYACGATLFNKHWLLSAAHCFLNFKNSYFEIQLGMLRRRSFTPHQKTYRIDRIITHHRFNIVTLDYDIALMRTSEPVTYDFWVRPICLPNREKVENSGSFCTAIGWGDTGESAEDSEDLQEVHVPLMSSCRNSGRWLCAGYPEGGRDACQGDSGGPLMCLQDDGLSWYVAGVISAGTGCARPRSPGMYTRVAYYLEWIKVTSFSKRSSEMPLSSCPGWRCAAVGGGNCLSPTKLCDGKVDCYDAQDEIQCFNGKKVLNRG